MPTKWREFMFGFAITADDDLVPVLELTGIDDEKTRVSREIAMPGGAPAFRKKIRERLWTSVTWLRPGTDILRDVRCVFEQTVLMEQASAELQKGPDEDAESDDGDASEVAGREREYAFVVTRDVAGRKRPMLEWRVVDPQTQRTRAWAFGEFSLEPGLDEAIMRIDDYMLDVEERLYSERWQYMLYAPDVVSLTDYYEIVSESKPDFFLQAPRDTIARRLRREEREDEAATEKKRAAAARKRKAPKNEPRTKKKSPTKRKR